MLSVHVALHQYTLSGFANTQVCCFVLQRLCVIKQWSANGGTCTAGGTQSYLAIITSFHNEIRYTEKHHLFRRWLSLSVWPFRLIGRKFCKNNFPWNYWLPDQVQYSTVLWLLELQIRCGRNVQAQVHSVNSNSRNSKWQCKQFSKKNPIIHIFCISGWTDVPVNPDKCSYTVRSMNIFVRKTFTKYVPKY